MSTGFYSSGKRNRDAVKADKKREKEARRWRRREEGPSEPEIVSAAEIVGDLPSIEEVMQGLSGGSGEPEDRSAAAIPVRLFVGGLSWDTTSETLRACFERFGPVSDAKVVIDRDTGRSRGFGFVEMANRKDGAKAIQAMDGADLDGRYVRVNVATERGPRAA